MDKVRYCWLNMNTGEFSNSWSEDEHTKHLNNGFMDLIDIANDTGWKLIKYSCINDANFEFYKMMQITTTKTNNNG